MPIYEYRCKKCSHQFELMRPVSQADSPCECPNCSHQDNIRMVSVVNAFISSGSEHKSITRGGCSSCSSASSHACSSCRR